MRAFRGLSCVSTLARRRTLCRPPIRLEKQTMRETILEHTAACHFADIGMELRLITPSCPLWTRSLKEAPFPEPWWGFCWPGSYALARWCYDNPEALRGKRVLDFATGCGASAIAACKSGSDHVVANDIDEWSTVACSFNAERNGVMLHERTENLIGMDRTRLDNVDIILAGDVLYEQDLAEEVTSWLGCLAADGVDVFIGDPGRHFLSRSKLRPIANYELPQEIRDDNFGHQIGSVWRFDRV